MNNFLKYRIAFITILFTAFGGILSTIMNIDSIPNWSYAAIASLISLVLSLYISFLLKEPWTKKIKTRVRRISTMLLVAFVISCFVFIWLFRFQLTFEVNEYDAAHSFADTTSGIAYSKPVRYVKGVYYTKDVRDTIKKDPDLARDPAALLKAAGGSKYIDFVWDKRSRDLAQFYLLLSYTVFVLLFVANVSLLCEVLTTKYKDKETTRITKEEKE